MVSNSDFEVNKHMFKKKRSIAFALAWRGRSENLKWI